jgi:FlaA1/EpsC-like NDP-sugar epimerase
VEVEALNGKNVVVTGGTGTLGRALVESIVNQCPASVTVLSRGENEQAKMRPDFPDVHFIIGDVRDYQAVRSAIRHADVVIHAAALKQVPACEYFPDEAIKTNVGGAQNIVRAIHDDGYPVETVVGISTDKACMPSCVYGNTKALQESIFIHANLDSKTIFASVRLGNLIGSRGSVALVFREQVASGGPVTITDPTMTRFWFGVEEAVALVITTVETAEQGDIIIPKIQSTTVADLARILIGDRPIKTRLIGIRPGEKLHETLITEEEALRAMETQGVIVLRPAISELTSYKGKGNMSHAYTSQDNLMTDTQLKDLLVRYDLC